MSHDVVVSDDDEENHDDEERCYSKPKHPVPALFDHLGISKIKTTDTFSLIYRDGILEAHVKRQSGKTETAVKSIKGGGFSQMTTFDPSQMNKSDRNELIRSKYAKGERQAALEKTFGLSQAMISRIVRG